MKNWQQEKKWWWQRVKNIYHWGVSWFYILKCGYPASKLTVVGVTGTDGKTTTSTLIYEMLRATGGKIKPALITTVAAKIGDTIIDTGLHTTDPDAKVLQPLLAKMVAQGVTHLVLEVTAHGVDQHRVLGTNISIGVLTNVTHDHLDDFITMKRYREAKLKMFKTVKFAILNKDDSSYDYIKARINRTLAKIVPYGRSNIKEVSEALQGEYNLYNLGAAVEVAKILGISTEVVARVARNFAGVPGRREEVKAGQRFRVFVDFAHTPNGLESVLKSLKVLKAFNTQLIVVFGCTGERDREKRPVMGRIAVDLADKVIVTSDDTRGESQEEIVRQILAGIPAGEMRKVTVENDRKEAIRMALLQARPGDLVLLAGKGHEKSINLGGKEYPWSDAETAKELLDISS
jgi:UDP-N-acetylmuramoyl-L-alanyl-D-glutamate--2,6-diaminopimelate ligase